MQTDDIAAWLTAIWDEDEKSAQGVVDRYAPDEAAIYLEDPWPEEAAYLPHTKPAAMLARIAADRQILALHSDSAAYCAWTHDDRDTHQDYAPCDTVKILALPHADRPGYNEDWRP